MCFFAFALCTCSVCLCRLCSGAATGTALRSTACQTLPAQDPRSVHRAEKGLTWSFFFFLVFFFLTLLFLNFLPLLCEAASVLCRRDAGRQLPAQQVARHRVCRQVCRQAGRKSHIARTHAHCC